MSLGRPFSLTWLGHSAFRLTTAAGKVILIDPWLEGNPACPEKERKQERADVILVTHGHFDHIGDVVRLGREHGSEVVCNFETGVWLGSQGLEKVHGMNKGGTISLAGIDASMVTADHSCGITERDASGRQVIRYGGEAAGYVVKLEDGFKIYHAGDTNVFGDMKLIGDLHGPDLALLPIGGHFTMGPREAAEAIRLLGVRRVIPMHFGTFPVLAGTPQSLREHCANIGGVEILALEPGQTLA